MSLKVVNGKIARQGDKLEKHRCAVVAATHEKVLQFISMNLMLRRVETPHRQPPVFEAPVQTAWDNMKNAYPREMADLSLVGVLVAELRSGEFHGHIDWVRPTDSMKIMDIDAPSRVMGDVPHEIVQSINVPVAITEQSPFVQAVMREPVLNAELAATKGGADMLASILNAIVRVAKREA